MYGKCAAHKKLRFGESKCILCHGAKLLFFSYTRVHAIIHQPPVHCISLANSARAPKRLRGVCAPLGSQDFAASLPLALLCIRSICVVLWAALGNTVYKARLKATGAGVWEREHGMPKSRARDRRLGLANFAGGRGRDPRMQNCESRCDERVLRFGALYMDIRRKSHAKSISSGNVQVLTKPQ